MSEQFMRSINTFANVFSLIVLAMFAVKEMNDNKRLRQELHQILRDSLSRQDQSQDD